MEDASTSDQRTGGGDNTQAWSPDTDADGWGEPVSPDTAPDPVRRRAALRSGTPGAPRSSWRPTQAPDRQGSGWDRDPAEWERTATSGPQAGRPSSARTTGPDPSATFVQPPAGANGHGNGRLADTGHPNGNTNGNGNANGTIYANGTGYRTGAATPGKTAPRPPSSSNPGSSNPGSYNPAGGPTPTAWDAYDRYRPSYESSEETGGSYAAEDYAAEDYAAEDYAAEDYASDEDYEADYDADEDYDADADYDARGYPTSHISPPEFPSDARRVRTQVYRSPSGSIIAVLLALVLLIGGGAYAALKLRSSPISTAGPDTTTTVPGLSTPTVAAPTTAAAPTTVAPPGAVAPNSVAPTTAAPTTAPTTTLPPTTPTTAASPSSTGQSLGLAAWTNQELPLIVQTKNDLTSLNQDLVGPPSFTTLNTDATNLQQDLQAAETSPLPSDPTVAQEWTQFLADLDTSNNALNGALQSQDPNIEADVAVAVNTTDTDYNTLSATLNHSVGPALTNFGRSEGRSHPRR